LQYLKDKNTFYFHATVNQNKLEFPYDLFTAKKLVIYSGGHTHCFYLTSYFAEIASIVHKHKSKIIGKENSKTEYYFEVKLKDTFSEDATIANNPNIKKWMKAYCEEYNLKVINYLPILTLEENIF
jgi:hypothetical protein